MEEKNKGGRPTVYSDEILIKARSYLTDPLPEDEIVHSIEGLAEHIGIVKNTIYNWEKQEDKAEFAEIVEEVRQRQAKTLLNNGLSGKFNSTITKVMLSKHGYREGLENMGRDGTPLIPQDKKEEIESAISEIIK